jgi:putative transposase
MLTVLDLYTRELLALVADRWLTGVKVAAALSHVLRQRAPQAITVDDGGEFCRPRHGRVGVRARRVPRFHPTGKPVKNAFIERFSGELRDECLNGHVVFASVIRQPTDS